MIGLQFLHCLTAIEFLAAVGALMELDIGHLVCLSLEGSGDGSAHQFDAFASTGWAGANDEHKLYTALG